MRAARKQSPADIYHVIARGVGKQLIFEDDRDRRFFMKLLVEALEDSSAELYAWCLMGNHFHLLVHAPISSLAQLMKQVCGRYAQWFNAKYGRVGHLFQERYKSEPVSDDEYLLTVVRYIHDNPSKAGIAPTAKYPWSSYREYAGRPIVCKTEFVTAVFGGREGFLSFHSGEPRGKSCLDIDEPRSKTRPMTDELALEIAQDLLGSTSLSDLKMLPIEERRQLLKSLKNAGLSIRQLERFTGIGRNAIAAS